MIRAIWATGFLTAITAAASAAPIVTYNLDLSAPGEFKIFASTSAEDNFGLALYALPFSQQTASMITGFNQISPFACVAQNESLDVGPVGFSLLRSKFTYPDGRLLVGAAQDTITGKSHLVRGFGQTDGSFSNLGITTISQAKQPSWNASLLLAQGTYSGDPNEFLLDTSNIDLVANVFSSMSGSNVIPAEVHINSTTGYSYVPQPKVTLPDPPPVAPPILDPPLVVNPTAPDPVVAPIQPDPPQVSDPLTHPDPGTPLSFEEAIKPGYDPRWAETGIVYFPSFPPMIDTIVTPWPHFGLDPAAIDVSFPIWRGDVDYLSVDIAGDGALIPTNYFGSSAVTHALFAMDGASAVSFSTFAALQLASLPAVPEPASIAMAALAFVAFIGTHRAFSRK